jgi:hypothetical protein
MKSISAIIASPLLCLGLLAGIVAEKRTQLKPEDAEPYHALAKEAIDSVGWTVDIKLDEKEETWSAAERVVPPAAVRLLKPNAILSRYYLENRTVGAKRRADLLIVQCRDSRDMTGHYPPICYPNSGHEMISQQARGPIEVGGERVPFMEYQFEIDTRGRPSRIWVYNFFIVPGKGIVREIRDVRDAAEDYQLRFFGATQFQVVMSAEMDLSIGKRDVIFEALLGELQEARVLTKLKSAELGRETPGPGPGDAPAAPSAQVAAAK